MYVFECWAMNEKEKIQMKVAEMRILRWVWSATSFRIELEMNVYRKRGLHRVTCTWPGKWNISRCFGHVKRRNNDEIFNHEDRGEILVYRKIGKRIRAKEEAKRKNTSGRPHLCGIKAKIKTKKTCVLKFDN